jgi:hypothetical protein
MRWVRHSWHSFSGETQETLKCLAGGCVALAIFLGLGWAGLI